MGLRTKLLLVGLVLLLLPMGGYQFIDKLERLLRKAAAESLIATTESIRRSLRADNPEMLDQATRGLYVWPRSFPVALDGYNADWQDTQASARYRDSATDLKVELYLGEFGRDLFVLVQVDDITPVRADPSEAFPELSDHIELSFILDDSRYDYSITSAGPGRIVARAEQSSDGLIGPGLQGFWQERPGGYAAELLLPGGAKLSGFALKVSDYALAGLGNPTSVAGTLQSGNVQMVPTLRYQPEVARKLSQLVGPLTRAWLVGADGTILASAGTLEGTVAPTPRSGWWSFIYRRVLAGSLQPARPQRQEAGYLTGAEVTSALGGANAVAWRDAPEGRVTASAAVPATTTGDGGAIVVEQVSEAMQLLTDEALASLVSLGVGIALVGGLALFTYATVLALRIRRLRNAADSALSGDGSISYDFPTSRSRDEIGDLSRSFAGLLRELEQYHEYLRTLASKLSHELRTPLAVVRSSLENLEHEPLTEEAADYANRAAAGADRLAGILRSMSEANRLEESIARTDREEFDLTDVVRGCVGGYQAVHANHSIVLKQPAEPLKVDGSPELLAQALDKLVDNAVSFTPAGGWIRVEVSQAEHDAVVAVANQGERLPDTLRSRLFDSMVSVREYHTDRAHLGLGLYIVRLIARFHGGEVSAQNLDDVSGVVFRITLPLVGRPITLSRITPIPPSKSPAGSAA